MPEVTPDPKPVPEPGSILAIATAGGLALAGIRRDLRRHLRRRSGEVVTSAC